MLTVRITDGRQRRRFPTERDWTTTIRIGLRQNPHPHLRLNIGPPKRGEGSSSDLQALELIRLLRSDVWVQLVPASRGAANDRFAGLLERLLNERLAKRAVHETQGGAPGEYRRVKRGIEDLAEIAEQLSAPLWDEMQMNLLPGLARSGAFELSASPRQMVDWMAQRLRFQLTTGAHDPASVAPTDVGSGLQSLLELALLRASAAESEAPQRILAVEEPEAFLHPSAQRQLATRLLDANEGQVIVSTHSRLFVEEAAASSVVLVRDHRFYEPRDADADLERVNTTLLRGPGAEMAFARSVLLAEGEGDRAYFDGLRRRIAEEHGWAHGAFAVGVGSSSSFGPWLQLLRMYGDDTARPIEWLVVADADATSVLRSALNSADMVVSTETRRQMRALEDARRVNDRTRATAASRELNRAAQENGERLHVLSVDLEWAMVSACDDDTRLALCETIGAPDLGMEQLAKWLGSKCLDLSGSSSGRKAPWMRSRIADIVPWAFVSSEAKGVMRSWLAPVAPSATALRRALRTVS